MEPVDVGGYYSGPSLMMSGPGLLPGSMSGFTALMQLQCRGF